VHQQHLPYAVAEQRRQRAAEAAPTSLGLERFEN
jgi:hypothetical protein